MASRFTRRQFLAAAAVSGGVAVSAGVAARTFNTCPEGGDTVEGWSHLYGTPGNTAYLPGNRDENTERWNHRIDAPSSQVLTGPEQAFVVESPNTPGYGTPSLRVRSLRLQDGGERWRQRITEPSLSDEAEFEYDVSTESPVLGLNYLLLPIGFEPAPPDDGDIVTGILALSRDSGEPQWLTGTELVEDVRVAGEVAFVLERGESLRKPHGGELPWNALSDGEVALRAMRIPSGDVCWSHTIPRAEDESFLWSAVDGDRYYLPSNVGGRSRIRAYRRTDGNRVTAFGLEERIAGGVSVAGETLLAVTSDATGEQPLDTVGISRTDGAVRWRVPSYDDTMPSTDGDVAFVRPDSETVACLDSKTGKERWNVTGNTAWTVPVDRHAVYALAPDHTRLKVVDKSTGRVRTTVEMGGSVRRTLLHPGGFLVVLASGDRSWIRNIPDSSLL